MYLLFPGGSRRKREVDDESNFFESDFGDGWFNDNDSFFGTEEEETTTQTSAAQLKKKIGDDDTVPDSDFSQYDSWYFDIDSVASGPKSADSCKRVRCNVNNPSMISEDMFRSFLQVRRRHVF